MAKEYRVTGRPSRPPMHPGRILRDDVFPTPGISVTEAARQMRVSRQTLHRVMAGTHPITPEMAVRLGCFCGNGPRLWLTMQQNHDLWHAERRLRDEVGRIPTHKPAA